MTCEPTQTKPVEQGTLEDLHTHLHAVVNLELWTIPLYLTALYSIESDTSAIDLPPSGSGTTSTVTDLLVSVALQEMYHLQLAGNLGVAFGISPALAWPTYDGAIPYLSTMPADNVVTLGTATDPALIELIIAVETPDTVAVQADIQYDANGQPCYTSIGDVYSVLKQLVDIHKADTNYPQAEQIANELFVSWYTTNKIGSVDDADNAVDIIVQQGEGAQGSQDAPLPAGDRPSTSTFPPHPWAVQDQFSHVERFTLIQGHTADVTTWPVSPGNAAAEQANLSAVFAKLIENLESGWTTGGGDPDLGPMMLMRTAITQVFQAGEIPAFTQTDATGYDAAVAALAPGAGATWEHNVAAYFTHTDAGAMKEVSGLDLTDPDAVMHHQSQIIDRVHPGGGMPPGNPWPQEMVESFMNWDGS